MRKTFVCDESMIITIPIGGLGVVREEQLMPEKFHCVFKDSYKVFVIKGKPQPLGAAQAVAGVFLFALGMMFRHIIFQMYTLPSIVFVLCGILSYAAGKYPNMHVTKLCFSLNIISFFWSIAAFSLALTSFHFPFGIRNIKLMDGITGLAIGLLVIENVIALFLIYWSSKAVCRTHFNSLPTILLKRGD
ncbi:membrane-spanning 4-domains subfamily A member 4A [Stegastes partitus]|uniref:Membrane spanning 4-domains A4A n=1 Tax=Stegastes partitus TaxID=144197 RepID=A0A3B4ZLX5_9TELE|nr:PREDICTED: membrane-spanning 4-domains subfamily A member 4A [Stegastes partitus]XP_008283917.1 PREDICTED: membrane-spanning 4-domains subfamily A member 4A [Stegastes partitus]